MVVEAAAVKVVAVAEVAFRTAAALVHWVYPTAVEVVAAADVPVEVEEKMDVEAVSD